MHWIAKPASGRTPSTLPGEANATLAVALSESVPRACTKFLFRIVPKSFCRVPHTKRKATGGSSGWCGSQWGVFPLPEGPITSESDHTLTVTVEDGPVTVFVAVDHCTTECVACTRPREPRGSKHWTSRATTVAVSACSDRHPQRARFLYVNSISSYDNLARKAPIGTRAAR